MPSTKGSVGGRRNAVSTIGRRLSALVWAYAGTGKEAGPPAADRRVISGIIHVPRVGCRWQDCPAAHGPSTTIYNRFNRWSHRGLARFAGRRGRVSVQDDRGRSAWSDPMWL